MNSKRTFLSFKPLHHQNHQLIKRPNSDRSIVNIRDKYHNVYNILRHARMAYVLHARMTSFNTILFRVKTDYTTSICNTNGKNWVVCISTLVGPSSKESKLIFSHVQWPLMNLLFVQITERATTTSRNASTYTSTATGNLRNSSNIVSLYFVQSVSI